MEYEDTKGREIYQPESRENMENNINLFHNTGILVNEVPASTPSIDQYQAKSPNSGVGKFTVMKRIQSALRMQEHKEWTYTEIERENLALNQKE